VFHRNDKWIVAILFCALVAVAAAALPAPAQEADREGFKDPTLFTRPARCVGDRVDEMDFDAYDFPVSRDKTEHVEGHLAKYQYRYDESHGARPSDLQVIRNYQNAATRIGGKVVYENGDHNQTTLRISKNGQDTWVSVEPYGPQYTLVIVERQAMKQEVVANAEAMKGGLAEVGHVEVPGIFFDFNKSDVKPESKPALDEVAKLLKANPSLKAWVVGHTDSVGSPESNLTLSSARAAAVVKALVTNYGISAIRLKGYGVGPFAPVASNDTEEGKAKNRRVELVKQ
jgi:outer membrane protein OmpA-like peptidoglycan-associated protein